MKRDMQRKMRSVQEHIVQKLSECEEDEISGGAPMNLELLDGLDNVMKNSDQVE